MNIQISEMSLSFPEFRLLGFELNECSDLFSKYIYIHESKLRKSHSFLRIISN